MILTHRVLRVLPLALVCVALAGCPGMGAKKVKVTGKIVKNGQPLTLQGPEYEEGGAGIDVTFTPVDASGNVDKERQAFSTRADANGTFVMDGDGSGIPAGKYKVSLVHEAGAMEMMQRGDASGGDLFGGKFSLQNTPFVFDIQNDQEITLDVGSASGGGGSAEGASGEEK